MKRLVDYSTKELAAELARRAHKAVAQSQKQARSNKQQLNKSKGDEKRLLADIPDHGTPNAYLDESMSTEQRLAEKMWWWLEQQDHGLTEAWANRWLEQHPADLVGTKNAANREAWLKKTLQKVPKGKKILDAGAGELQYKRFCKHLDYVSQDFGQYTGEGDIGLQQGTWDNSKLDIVSDITDIPVADASFDAIMCIEVFEHIPKPLEAIKEFARILKPGGQLITAAPFASFTHFAPYYFYNGYSRYFYEKILAEYGFEIQEIYLNGNFFECVAQEIRRIDEMASRYAPNAPKPTAFDQLIIRSVLRRLEILSAKDAGSNEFAVHDIDVLAIKK